MALLHATSNTLLYATLWHFFMQHLTRSCCYAVALLLATSKSLLKSTLWQFFLQHPTRSWCYAMALLLATSNTVLMPTLCHFFLQHATRSWCYAVALLEQGAWLGTRSSSSCRTLAKSVKWINKSMGMLPETFVELVAAVKSAKKADFLCFWAELWQTQIVLVFAMNSNGYPFSLAFAGVLNDHFHAPCTDTW